MKQKQKKCYLHNFKLAKKFVATATLAVTAFGLGQPIFTTLNNTVVQADEGRLHIRTSLLNF